MKRLPSFLQTNEPVVANENVGSRSKTAFIDKTLYISTRFLTQGIIQTDWAMRNGFAQRMHPQVKVWLLLLVVIGTSIFHTIVQQALVSLCLIVLFAFSKLTELIVFKRIGLVSFLFGGLLVLPAMLNVFTLGEIVVPILRFSSAKQWWIYYIPEEVGITREGIAFVVRFFLRVLNSVSVTFWVLYTTPFNDIIKALKVLRIPDVFLMVVMLTWKFLFVLTQTLEESYMALKSRWWNRIKNQEASQIVAGRVSYIFRRAWIRYDEMYKAMLARGYTGRVGVLSQSSWRWGDWIFILLMLFYIVGVYLVAFRFL